MSDWSTDLHDALAAGDPAYMKAMLARVPPHVLRLAIPYLQEMAKASVADGKLDEALTFYGQLLDVEPGNTEWRAERARVYFKLDELPEALADAERIVQSRPELPLGYRLRAEAHDGLRHKQEALAAYQQVLRLEPTDEQSAQRVRFLEAEIRKAALLEQVLDPAAAPQALQVAVPPPPRVEFDPALFNDPSIDASFDQNMVEGLRQLLWRHSAHQSPRNILARLEDPEWVCAWDTALAATHGSTVLFQGSELGVLALRARASGAKRVVDAELYPLDGRIAGGVVQKNLLAAWHALHGSAIQSWTEEQRHASFTAFAENIEIATPQSEELAQLRYDYFVFPNLDHSLLGTGIVKAIRRVRSQAAHAHAKVLPRRAQLFAMPIQWLYGANPLRLDPMNALRWSFYPQALELSAEHWLALAAPTPIGTANFEEFSEAQCDVEALITAHGDVDAVLYWFELDLGSTRISNAPGSSLRCIRPAVQYCDPVPVQPGQRLALRATLSETRLHIEILPSPSRSRSHQLPSWYVPMLLDRSRNDSYRAALERALQSRPAATVLDIGAGCGLLSMMAARAGAQRVLGCEASSALSALAEQTVRLNELSDRIVIKAKDCRELIVPDDLPERADVAVFEVFDCSLIGEGVLHFLAHARQNLLKADARYVPMAGRIVAMLIEYRLERILDVDVNLLNPYRFAPSFINVDANDLTWRALTAPFEVFAFDFSQAGPTPEEKRLVLPTTGEGTAGAILFWFDLQMDETTRLSNAPTASAPLHWKQGLQFLPEVRIGSGTQVPILAKHDGSALEFRWEKDAFAKDAISALPRFDPRWWQQAKELEHQTQSLLQHCMHNPDQYQKVAQLAARFAVDPASHDIDASIAQRLARIFFSA